MRNHKFIIVLFLTLLLSTPKAFADGGSWIITYGQDRWIVNNQNKQIGIIDYKDGNEELTILINSELTGDEAVWIFPIPAKPEESTIDIVEEIPRFSGYEVKSKIGYEINKMYPTVILSQLYTYPALFYHFFLSSMTAGGGTWEGYGKEKGVTIHEHLERAGLITELVTTEDENKLNDYLREKSLNLPQQSLSLIKEYVGKDYSFVVSWVSDIEKYKRETGGSTLGVKTIFPTDELYYPLKLTSIYGDRRISIVIYVLGRVSPKIYSSIKRDTKVNYYLGNERYTKIKINSRADHLIDDLWISRYTPIEILFADLIVINPLVFMIIIFALCSVAASIISGLIVFRASIPIKRLAFLGLWNFTTLLGFFIATYVFLREKKEKIRKLGIFIFISLINLSLVLPCFVFYFPSFQFLRFSALILISSWMLCLILLVKLGLKRLGFVILFSIIFLFLTGMFYYAVMTVYPYKVSMSMTMLSIVDTECTRSGVTVWVMNDGRDSGQVDVDVEGYRCTIDSIETGETEICTTVGRPEGTGYHTIRVSALGTSLRGSVYCK